MTGRRNAAAVITFVLFMLLVASAVYAGLYGEPSSVLQRGRILIAPERTTD